MTAPSKFQVMLMVASALGGLTAFLTWMENRKSNKLKEEVMNLDKQIKELELSKKMMPISQA